ncbi:MAG TPA: YibE/F family protein [Candidatus Intestinimonas stercoravium]|uniref:YibE/F family protein n=1 Tax=uncultured Intestinimonas sp. TaxID=1689265 RepID=UPI001FA2DB99|nr:YibE/F family protein [uncultured Intestinimonas sp.]HJA62893.1 YibE/F family protein [Candidatus Intestinimonas stercoravium]
MKTKTPAALLKRWAPPVVLLILFTLFVIAINDVDKAQLVVREGQTFEKGVVTAIIQDNLQPNGTRVGEQVVEVQMLTGVRKGQTLETTSSSGYLFGAGCTVGMHVVVLQSVAGDSTITSVYSQDRGWVIYLFAGLYLLALCLVGGKQGVKGALGLVFTFACIILVYLPLVYQGCSPFWVSVFVCIITTVVTLWLIGGPTRKTVVATGGTVAGVIISGLAATLFSMASGISGYNVSDIESLLTLWNVSGIQVGGLLFSGLLISSLGAVMDVAMSIASSIAEVRAQNPSLTRKELFWAGMHIGRDMMGTDSNTLILAFAGGSVSMLLLDYAYDLPYLQIINSNNIGIAIMQGLSGSFGIVLSVPVTVALAVLLYMTPGALREEKAKAALREKDQEIA